MSFIRKYSLFFALFIMLSQAGCAKQHMIQTPLSGTWKVALTTPDAGELTVMMNFDVTKEDAKGIYDYEAHTHHNADRKIFGFWKSQMARWFSSNFKKGSLMRITKGKLTKNDSVSGVLISPITNYYFSVRLQGDKMNGYLLDGNYHIVGLVNGIKGKPQLPLRNYAMLADSILHFTESVIYDPAIVSSRDWRSFSHTLRNSAGSCLDDADFALLFYYYSHKLPFTHFMLYQYSREQPIPGDDDEKHVTLQAKSPTTMYMKINSFSGTAGEMDSAFNVINKGSYENLVIDLRDNPGGSAEAGIAFSGHLTTDTAYGGIFLTQRYFRQHQTLPTPREYSAFPRFSEASFNLIIKGIHEQQGLYLQLIPRSPLYTGRVYILTNGNTASTCEPIVYSMKKTKRAIIVGERTAGAMLNGETFPMPDGYKLVVPTATYYTTDGYKIDRQGVAPDIEVPAKDALTNVLKQLNVAQ